MIIYSKGKTAQSEVYEGDTYTKALNQSLKKTKPTDENSESIEIIFKRFECLMMDRKDTKEAWIGYRRATKLCKGRNEEGDSDVD